MSYRIEVRGTWGDGKASTGLLTNYPALGGYSVQDEGATYIASVTEPVGVALRDQIAADARYEVVSAVEAPDEQQ